MKLNIKKFMMTEMQQRSVRCCRKGCGDIYDCADQRRLIMPEGGT